MKKTFLGALLALSLTGMNVLAESKSAALKGEYRLARTPYAASICQPMTKNLNQFRKIDFDDCNPRLSEKYPEFTRPEWEEIPFDMAIAEKVIKSSGSYGFSQINQPTQEAIDKVAEAHWQKWKDLTASFRQQGKGRMWRLKVDFNGDGEEETLIRMVPGDRNLVGVEVGSAPLNKWDCDYSRGQIYVLEAKNPRAMGVFQRSYLRGTDLIHYAGDGHYYLLEYQDSDASGRGYLLPVVGATRSILVQEIYSGPNFLEAHAPVSVCFIEWFPTGVPIAPYKVPPKKH